MRSQHITVALAALLISSLSYGAGQSLPDGALISKLVPSKANILKFKEGARNPFLREIAIKEEAKSDYQSLNERILKFFSAGAGLLEESSLKSVIRGDGTTPGGIGIGGEYFPVGSEIKFDSILGETPAVKDARLFLKVISPGSLLLGVVPIAIGDANDDQKPNAYDLTVELPEFFK